MGYTFRKLRKLWLLYLFLLFFSFFMFAISINVYLSSLKTKSDIGWNGEENRRLHPRPTKNVVAHYIGTGNIFGNLTKDDYNTNNFEPIEGEGALGRPVIIPPRESFKMQRLFKLNSFNLLASDRIPLNRTLKDYRIKECRSIDYSNQQLPTTSIIIVFHNEAWSVLLRTLWSVINRSPHHLIKEIILIDDASDREYLKAPLEEYIEKLPVLIRIFRMEQRKGLVPARLRGADLAKGDVLTFLDAHCECSDGWLEPLLAGIKEDRKTAICPVIDIISDNNFGYTKTFENHWGAFNWQLNFRWFLLDNNTMKKRATNPALPIATPGMAGGLFSIDKSYFYEMGAYDSEMKIWGGENVEMSFRLWQCGGSIKISPCSHVGHIFRSSTPYTFPGGISKVLSGNLARAATVWMDQWKEFYFLYNQVDMALKNSLNVSDRVALRKRLNCKPFSWYLENIWPENFFPADDRFFGKIFWLNGGTEITEVYNKHMTETISSTNVPKTWTDVFIHLYTNANKVMNHISLDNDKCIKPIPQEGQYASYALSAVKVGNCNPDSKLQDMFVITTKGQIMTNENVCLDYIVHKNTKYFKTPGSNVQLFQCFDDARQHWFYDLKTQHIVHQIQKLCLTVQTIDEQNKERLINAQECRTNDVSQKWGLVPLPWKF